ncbi:exodeoxyribonuclease VII small subunit [Ketogulonicigenium vulgare]|uniref:Exodeoxyribonuclease 7 small subunit n=1 Tax=Ketogulonicigenium vulgare (strain WSH-001) TaxID=759362 RepID=F9Y858_KETVW|nr:exodeoxyribonuclease VII small subunit [Ketogulonicigenium vulgare]ADO41491.1 exodeoxyribonuclease VII, small subunit [Ketogulonicigenium vulgare Y25]AEM42344.1 exodeoxyribonuclease VII small chain [Ketogulonicigenium vulgare WSH-001]ALJ79969.1 exodeoxyribonuclease VII small subunit [Ketogulonicigenium vulgare]ANW34841.1 exodeoxyribonuclease VII small subunit [Ketogulonicigenium vulgare]AOZ53426.1 exodeoxyribonuclease VII, small subunit [Ketogulonicigenium vulgare]
MTQKPVADLSFEEALAELEQIVAQLERGDVPLEESISRYQRGAELRARCTAKLNEAQEKIARITIGENGQPAGLQPFEA